MTKRRARKTKPPARSPDPGVLVKAVVDASPECIKLVDREGRLLQMNRAGLQMIDAGSEQEVVGRSVVDMVVPEHQAAFRELLVKVLAGARSTLEFEIIGLKGRRRWLETHAVPLRYPTDRQAPIVLAVTRDITDRREAEQALRDRENLYRALFENAPIGLGIADLNGNLLAFNDAIRSPGGYSDADIRAIGNVARLYAEPADRDRALELARRNGYLYRFQTQFLRKDGSRYDALMSLTPVEVGGKRCWLALVEDVTAQRRAELARHSAEERYRTFIAQSTEAIYRFELDEPLSPALAEDEQIDHWYRHAYLAECNDAMARMYGYPSAQEMLGRRVSDLMVRSDARNEDLIRAFIRSGYRLTDVESRDRDRGGRARVFLNNLVGSVENGMLRRAWGTQRDVTERKLLEEQLRQAQKMEAIGRLAGGVAHDFNNLLTAMLGSVELLMSNLPPSDPRAEDASNIKTAAARAAALTRQLLAFSRRQLLRPQVLQLNGVVREVQRLLRRLVSEDIELVTRLATELRPVQSDRGQLEQVIVNLVVNARDAMPNGGVVIIETANVDLDEAFVQSHPGAVAGRYVLLAVHDTGEGMDAETRAHLFEPFFTTKGAGKGTGLGLATVYGIVKQSGGYITVDSERGRGTSFRIYLQAAVAGAAATEAAEVSDPAPAAVTMVVEPEEERDPRGGNETILIVEDEERIRVSARRILEHYGYRVLVAADGQEAFEKLSEDERGVDLVVSDVVMPRLSGTQLYEALREQGKLVPFLFTSGYVGKDSRSKLLLDPTVPFLPKPWTAHELVTRVREILDQATATKTD